MKDTNVENKLEAQAKADNTIRASLKSKMLKAGPDQFVEAELAQRNSKAEARVYAPSEAGLAAMAGTAEPDHAAHLDRVDTQQTEDVPFEVVVKPLMQWLAQNACPHHHVVVSATSAELFQGQKSFNTFEFIKD